jgi:hypothetical protein
MVQPLPRPFAARAGTPVDGGVDEPRMEMPFARVCRIGRQRELLSRHTQIQIVIRPLDGWFLFVQQHDQLHRVHSGVIGHLEQELPR